MSFHNKTALFWIITLLALVYCSGLTFLCVIGYPTFILYPLLGLATLKLGVLTKVSFDKQ